MAVLKQTSPTACPVAPSPKPSRTVPSANTSSAVALGSSQVLPEAFAGDWVMSLLLAYYIVRGKGPSDSAPNRVNIEQRGVPVLRDDINKALTEAMKAKNERAVSTLRMVNSTLKNADIEARGAGKPPLGDAEVLAQLQKMIKQRQESVELYQKGGRADLVKQEQEEIAIITGYLPKQMSDAEMTAAIEAAVKETGAAGMKDMGKVIGVLRGKYAGQMDMAKASGMVKTKLAG